MQKADRVFRFFLRDISSEEVNMAIPHFKVFSGTLTF